MSKWVSFKDETVPSANESSNVPLEMPVEIVETKDNNQQTDGKEEIKFSAVSPTATPNLTYLQNMNTKSWQVNFNQFPLVDIEGSNIENKDVVEFYEKQNEIVDEYAKLYKSKLEHDDEDETMSSSVKSETDELKERSMFEKEDDVSPAMRRLEYWCIHLSK